MTENIKLCPECDAEYFAHAEKCSSCDVELVFPDQTPAAHDHDHGDPGLSWPEGPSDVLMEASLEILNEMGTVLNDNKMPFEIYEKPHIEGLEDQKNTSSCQTGESEYAMVVPRVHLEESTRITEEHWYKMHPEQVESDERTSQGKCPACAADLQGKFEECPSCGLNLSIIAVPNHDDCC